MTIWEDIRPHLWWIIGSLVLMGAVWGYTAVYAHFDDSPHSEGSCVGDECRMQRERPY